MDNYLTTMACQSGSIEDLFDLTLFKNAYLFDLFCALSNICSITLLNNNSYEGMLEPQSRKEFESKEEE